MRRDLSVVPEPDPFEPPRPQVGIEPVKTKPELKDPASFGESFKFAMKCAFALAWSFAPVGVGVILTLTTIGAPVGIPLIIAGVYPLYRTINQRTKHQIAWSQRGRALDSDEEVKPWME
jgi:hypothetical protein